LRDAKYNAAIRHAASCMGATELQSNWPEMRKTLRKPGEWKVERSCGQDGNRTVERFPDVFEEFESGRRLRKT
jgi:hypothetical protein